MFYNNNYQLDFLSQKKHDSIFLEDSKIPEISDDILKSSIVLKIMIIN